MLTALLWAGALVAALLAWRGPLWRPRTPFPGLPGSRPRLLGHRGVRGPERENSVAAIRLAFEAGLDGVELDVQRTRDGALVLHHDLDLEGRIPTELTLDEARRLDPDLATLSELAALLRRYPAAVVNLELKTAPGARGAPRLARETARWVRREGFARRTVVSSFDPLALLWFRLAAPRLRVGLLTAPDLPRWLASGSAAPWLHVDAVHLHHSQVTAERLRDLDARGVAVMTWTVNDPREVARVANLGVVGIIADDPTALRGAAAAAGVALREPPNTTDAPSEPAHAARRAAPTDPPRETSR